MADPVLLAGHTTLRLGGPTASLVEAESNEAIVEEVRRRDMAREPVLVLGDGSNVVVADTGFAGTTVRIANRGRRFERRPDGRVVLHVAAGENWDSVVAEVVDEKLGRAECLSGIPGRVGALPIQNVNAYGVSTEDLLTSVDLYDRGAGLVRSSVSAGALQLGYRTSSLRGRDAAVVLGLRLLLTSDGLSAPITYDDLIAALEVKPGTRVPVATAREAVLSVRRDKGMLLDPADHDTWSVGSFFVNPVLPAADAPDGVPRRPAEPGLVKLSAAALIELAGFRRGHPGPGGRVALSSKHVLALTNRGGGRAADLLELALEIRDAVFARFGVELQPEPMFVGCDWPTVTGAGRLSL